MASDTHEQVELAARERTSLGRLAGMTVVGGLIVGVVGLGAALLAGLMGETGMKRFMHAYVANYAFWLSLSLGGLLFVLIQHLTRCGATVTVRRVGEIIAANVALMAVLFVPILLGMGTLYKYWVPIDPADELAAHKAAYLNVPFFVIRWIIYFIVWIGLAWVLLRRSRLQDQTGDKQLTLANQSLAPIGIVLVGLTLTFASIDLLKSLDAHWFSSIFGVYYFAGSFMAFYALLAVILAGLQGRGILATAVTADHYHDIGKMMFGFVVFWAYIAYSQYMLIRYANIPEETIWFIRHGGSTDPRHFAEHGAWSIVLLVLLFGHFVLPFFGLVSRHAKRRRVLLAGWAIWLLAMHWLDMVWLVRPELKIGKALPAPVNWVDIVCLVGLFIGIGGFYLAGLARLATADRPIIALRDPRLDESLAFENH